MLKLQDDDETFYFREPSDIVTFTTQRKRFEKCYLHSIAVHCKGVSRILLNYKNEAQFEQNVQYLLNFMRRGHEQ